VARPSLKIVLVLLALLVNVTATMKRIFALIVLLGVVMSAVLTGCGNGDTTPKTDSTTNAPAAPSMPASTNK
jgi:hypothetical protein